MYKRLCSFSRGFSKRDENEQKNENLKIIFDFESKKNVNLSSSKTCVVCLKEEKLNALNLMSKIEHFSASKV
jgi:hypothetical protein